MGIALPLLFCLFVIVLVFAFLDYMDFLKKPEVKVDTLEGDTYIVYTFQGSLADTTRCTEYALNHMKFVLGRLFYFPKVLCFYHSLPEGNQIPGKFTLMFPIGDKPVLQKLLADLSDKKLLTVFQTPALRAITSSYPYHNLLSYSLGQIRVHPSILRFAKTSGIEDVSTMIEVYETNQPIRYYLILEKTNLFDLLRNGYVISADSM
ncbi:hypothetical protein AV274_5085 [Blastocystis sp. ATCC 50177/Nand II]|uniref:Uncharacterized protein n=1 Tax=Blastocystis sp. subtype 1 (strain ATCC 50177 / NandII) TaxID=478820 RepID=A0A196SB54_BLAHN|nr:hypothetical protein AV274_5085 [Blastocystis sp. ATCC 50177/Nand II]